MLAITRRSLWISIGFAGQFVAPFACSLLSVTLAIQRSSRKRVNAIRSEREDHQEGTRNSSVPRSLDTSRWSPELLLALEWKRFEEVCATYFETLQFRARLATAGPDGGVDIHLFSQGELAPCIVVQCKAWRTRQVGVSTVRELRGAMASANIAEGILVTITGFTDDARDFAQRNNIHLIDGSNLLEKFLATEEEHQRTLLQVATSGDFTTPTCPSCGIKMVGRDVRNTGEAFWGCRNFPRCRTTLRGA